MWYFYYISSDPEGESLHAPKTPSIINLYSYFGGLNLEEEDDILETEKSIISNSRSTVMSLRLKSVISTREKSFETENSSQETYFLIVKGFIGIGLLFIPSYYRSLGYLITTGILLVTSIIIYMGIRKLIECKKMCDVDYPRLVELWFGFILKGLVNCFLNIGQGMYGVSCLFYIILNLLHIIGPDDTNIAKWIIFCVLSFILGGLVCIRQIAKLQIIFIISSITMGGILVILLILSIVIGDFSDFKAFGDLKFFPIIRFIGICFFAFEGYGIILPSYQQMENKKSYSKVLILSMVSLFIFYFVFGLFSSLENLPNESAINFGALKGYSNVYQTLGYIIYAIFILCLIVHYLLIIYPFLRIIEELIRPYTENKYILNCVRFVFVIILVFFATLLQEKFIYVISIIGFLINVPLIVIIPSICHYKIAAINLNEKISDLSLFIAGSLICLGGIICTIISLF